MTGNGQKRVQPFNKRAQTLFFIEQNMAAQVYLQGTSARRARQTGLESPFGLRPFAAMPRNTRADLPAKITGMPMSACPFCSGEEMCCQSILIAPVMSALMVSPRFSSVWPDA
jgi:hypothetical protein